MCIKLNKFLLPVLVFIAIPWLLSAKIIKGPYLVSPGTNSMTIMWECDSNSPVTLSYWGDESGKETKVINSFDSQDTLFLFKVKLIGLKINQKYNYSVVTENGEKEESSFYTNPPKNTPFKFVVMGDSRTRHNVFSAVMEATKNYNPVIIINMGDLVRRGKLLTDWNPHYFDPAKGVINHIPLISTLGDHETAGNNNGYNFYYYFRNGVNVDSMWFSYDVGDIHFISLDYRRAKDPGMIKWFIEDVKKSKVKWKIVYLHRPTYNLGGHRSHWGNPQWQKLFRDNKIDIVFAGHSHLYERFFPMAPQTEKDAWPVTYITTGGAGAELYDAVRNNYLAAGNAVNHFLEGYVNGDTLSFITKLLDGNTLDKFKLIKHNDKYNDSYLKTVKPQEYMDIYMAFASNLVVHFNSIPTDKIPAKKAIEFDAAGIPFDVQFKMFLDEKSSKYYEFKPIEGVLKENSSFQDTVALYSKKDNKLKIRQNIYFDPPIIFNISFKYNGKETIVIGRESRYYKSKKK